MNYRDWDRVYAVHRASHPPNDIPPPGDWSGPFYERKREAVPELEYLSSRGGRWVILEWEWSGRRWLWSHLTADPTQECPT